MAHSAHCGDDWTAWMIACICACPVWMFSGGCSSFGDSLVMNTTFASVPLAQSVVNWAWVLFNTFPGPPVAQLDQSAR